jgi:hypothetical protein
MTRSQTLAVLQVKSVEQPCAAVPSAFGDDVPFAQPMPSASSTPLGDIMSGVQLRHIKLWEAIRGRNWPLVRFEATLIGDSLAAAAMLYRNIPIDYVTNAGKPLVELQIASTTGDAVKLAALFADLTAACNACHAAGNVAFIQIKTPSSSPFSDQRFAPGEK